MRTTVELPDRLFRRAKAEAALRGRKFKDLVEEGLRLALATSRAGRRERDKRPTLHDLMKDYSGIADSGVADLATDPKHMRGFGRDSLGHR